MPKKPATTRASKTAKPAKTTSKKAKATAAAAPAKSGGMWKILEMKKAQHKLNEQARSEGRTQHGQGQTFQSHPRDPRFSKFAGPRRKAG